MKLHYHPQLIPGRESLLTRTLDLLLWTYKPRPGQTRIENAELLTLAAEMAVMLTAATQTNERYYREAIERSQVWVEL